MFKNKRALTNLQLNSSAKWTEGSTFSVTSRLIYEGGGEMATLSLEKPKPPSESKDKGEMKDNKEKKTSFLRNLGDSASKLAADGYEAAKKGAKKTGEALSAASKAAVDKIMKETGYDNPKQAHQYIKAEARVRAYSLIGLKKGFYEALREVEEEDAKDAARIKKENEPTAAKSKE